MRSSPGMVAGRVATAGAAGSSKTTCITSFGMSPQSWRSTLPMRPRREMPCSSRSARPRSRLRKGSSCSTVTRSSIRCVTRATIGVGTPSRKSRAIGCAPGAGATVATSPTSARMACSASASSATKRTPNSPACPPASAAQTTSPSASSGAPRGGHSKRHARRAPISGRYAARSERPPRLRFSASASKGSSKSRCASETRTSSGTRTSSFDRRSWAACMAGFS